MKAWIDTALPIVMAIAASLAVFLNLTLVGPMAWHFQQPAAVQGGIEAILLLTMLAFFATRDGKSRWFGIAALLAFYLRRHHVDVPVLIVLLVAEGLVSAGAVADRSNDTPDIWRSVRRMVLGLCLWLAILLVLHANGLARPGLSLGILLLTSITLLLVRRQSSVVAPTLRAFSKRPAPERAGWALLAGWFVVLMARSNHVIGSDTLWYLIRGQYVLAPNGSFFEPLGLVSAVHYFPKLWELLLLPWDAASDLSFGVGFDLMLLATGLMALAIVLRRLGINRTMLPLALLAIATLPAISSAVLQLKTDIAAWMFCMVALAAAARWFEYGGRKPIIWIACSIGLACCAKLTALPYMGVLVLAVAALSVLQRSPTIRDAQAADPIKTTGFSDWMLLGLTFCIGLSMLWRTLVTSGMPTIGPGPLVSIWNLLGMHLKAPAGTLDWLRPQDWSDAPWLLPEALFAPNELPKVRITWIGNIWFLCGLLVLLWRGAADSSQPDPGRQQLSRALWAVSATGLLLLLGWEYHVRGSDGNYFIVALSAVSCLGFAAVSRLANTISRRRGLVVMLLICSAWQAALGFVSSAWSSPGTRAFDLDLGRSVLDTRATLAHRRTLAGLDPIYRILKGLPADTRVVGVGKSVDVHLLPLRVEALEAIYYSRPEYLASAEALRDFLVADCIDYVLIGNPPGVRGEYAKGAVAKLHAEVVLSDGNWSLYRLESCPSTDE
ncbi:MAG: hypothetical protein KDI78_11250 [Xanthomonadales bacterium]|nr:hypothetical protein [Xanthomonadales bacterium]